LRFSFTEFWASAPNLRSLKRSSCAWISLSKVCCAVIANWGDCNVVNRFSRARSRSDVIVLVGEKMYGLLGEGFLNVDREVSAEV